VNRDSNSRNGNIAKMGRDASLGDDSLEDEEHADTYNGNSNSQ
jgi:hypothetical protein